MFCDSNIIYNIKSISVLFDLFFLQFLITVIKTINVIIEIIANAFGKLQRINFFTYLKILFKYTKSILPSNLG